MPGLYDMELLRAGDAAEKASEVGSGRVGSGPILSYSNNAALIQHNNKSLT